MECAICEAKTASNGRGSSSNGRSAEDQTLLSKSVSVFPPEVKSDDRSIEVKGEDSKLTKVGSEKSIFSSIRERLDPLTSLLQEGIEGTKDIIDRKLRKSESVAEAQDVVINSRVSDIADAKDPLAKMSDSFDLSMLVFSRSGSVEVKDETEDLGSIFRKSTSADSFQNRKCQFLNENDAILLTSTDEDVPSDETSQEMQDFGERCSLGSSQEENLRLATHDISAQHFSFETCDYSAKEIVSLKPLQPLTALLWNKSRSFILSHKIKILVGIVFSALWLLLPFPSFVSGLILGIFLASGVAWLLQWLKISTTCITPEPQPATKDGFLAMPKPANEMKIPNCLEIFQGWMNEISCYEPNNFHISQTRSVYVTINNSILRLETPKYNLHRRSMWQERFPNPDFILKREFSLVDSKVLLVPHGLVKKRLWCKKYPICVIASAIETEANPEEIDAGIDVLKGFDSVCISSMFRSENDSIKDSSVDPDIESVFGDEENFHEWKPKMTELFLFARSNREKEEWYRQFVASTLMELQLNETEQATLTMETKLSGSKTLTEAEKRQRTSSSDSTSESLNLNTEGSFSQILEKNQTNYMQYMSRIVAPSKMLVEDEIENDFPVSGSPLHEKQSLKLDVASLPLVATVCGIELQWLNALLARFFFDFLHESSWAEKMKDKLQAMLSKIHVPQFMDQLKITDIDLGGTIPAIGHASVPYLDNRGLWVDLDVSYEGGFCITMETKCNLMKVTQTKREELSESPVHEKRSAVTHSDEEDSAESSTDEELPEDSGDVTDERRNTSSATSKRLLRLVDKITQSRYFQHAADYKYIKKAIREVANTPLVLIVELNHLSGVLSLNIPPPPTDRLWYGFKGNPSLQLSVKPKVGDRVVSVGHITDWIEKKLELEFQRIYVIPNMDDLIIPLMCDHITSNF